MEQRRDSSTKFEKRKKQLDHRRLVMKHGQFYKHLFEAKCRDPGSNWGPSDLQSDALPTELSRLGLISSASAQLGAERRQHFKLPQTTIAHRTKTIRLLPKVCKNEKRHSVWFVLGC